MNTTETTLDAVVLMEQISEFAGRTVHFTSHGMEFRGELVTVLDRGNGVPTDRRLTVILRDDKEAVTGFRTRIAVERAGWVDAVDFMQKLSSAEGCELCTNLEAAECPHAADGGAHSEIELNETITHLPDYDGHWKGEAYQTHHEYGVQIHRTRWHAERWNAQRKALAESFYTPAAGDADKYNELGQPSGYVHRSAG